MTSCCRKKNDLYFEYEVFLISTPTGARLDTATGARAVPARSTSLGRGGLENSRVFRLEKPLRTGTVRGQAVAVSCASATSLCKLVVVSMTYETKKAKPGSNQP